MAADASSFDVLVVGGGPAGLASALALAKAGARTAIAAPPHRPTGDKPDTRTAALFPGSIAMLDNLGVWRGLAPQCAVMRAIRLVDDRATLLRAPEVTFEAKEIGADDFGFNVPNAPLVVALEHQCRDRASGVTFIDTKGATNVAVGADGVTVTLAEGRTVHARLLVAADGRHSMAREAAGITTSTWKYDQSAVTTIFEHGRPHLGISTELHREAGPCTVVPMPGNTSSLVWVERPDVAERLAGLDEAEFRRALEARYRSLLGPIGAIAPRNVFPLSGLTPDAYAANRVALVGESAHVVPPIGAQGLNLGLRDGATLADCVRDAIERGEDIGGAGVMAAYDRGRRADIASRVWSIDLLNKSLLSPLLPVHLLRGAGLFALKSIGPLRRLLIREGLQPSFAEPRLMRHHEPRAS